MSKKTETTETIITIKKKDKATGTVYLRDGITAAFFLPTPMDKVVGAILTVFDAYLKLIPPDALKWESVGSGSEEWRAMNKSTFDRCRAQLRAEAARKRDLTSFELADGDESGDAPGYGITVIGNPVDAELPEEKCLAQMYFPSTWARADKVDQFVGEIRKMIEELPYTYGYVSPSLNWAELFSTEAMQQSRAIAMRYPGFDVQDNVNGRTDIGVRTRGARWLTFLGPELTKKLGGVKVLQNKLRPPIVVEEVGKGLMIRAGNEPEIGDLNAKIGTPLLRLVAKMLEPVTAFQEPALFGKEFADPDDNFLDKWERRFLR